MEAVLGKGDDGILREGGKLVFSHIAVLIRGRVDATFDLSSGLRDQAYCVMAGLHCGSWY